MLETLGVLLFACFLFYALISDKPKVYIMAVLLGASMFCVGGFMLLLLYSVVAVLLYVVVNL